MNEVVPFYIGSDPRVGKETLDKVRKVEGHKMTYRASSGGILPGDGYVSIFSVEKIEDVVRINKELSEIKGVEGPTMFNATGPFTMEELKAVLEKEKKYE